VPIDLAIPGTGVAFRANNSLANVFGESGLASGGSGVGFSVPDTAIWSASAKNCQSGADL
jgi:hypothetical protein